MRECLLRIGFTKLRQQYEVRRKLRARLVCHYASSVRRVLRGLEALCQLRATNSPVADRVDSFALRMVQRRVVNRLRRLVVIRKGGIYDAEDHRRRVQAIQWRAMTARWKAFHSRKHLQHLEYQVV